MVKYILIVLLAFYFIIIIVGLLIGLAEVRKEQKERDKTGGL